jgi:LCP family protein required for cell wall assembly
VTDTPRPTRAGHRRPVRPAQRRAVVAAVSFTLLLGLGVGGIGLYEYTHLSGQIKHVDALQTKDPNIKQAAVQLHAANYLVIGSDSRAGANSTTHDIAGERSDTTILIHLSKNHRHVTVVSFPRDSWVAIPTCKATNTDFGTLGRMVPAHTDMFNSAFSIGGAKCTIATIQKLTGIKITHYLKLDFVGFKDVVNALGRVPVCSQKAVYDPDSHLRLKAGINKLDGAQALAFVRARHAFTGGSDLGRIKRQQQFLGIVLRQALSGSLLSNPIKLTNFLDAVTRAITTDPDTSIGDLRTLGSSMSGLDPKKVVFYTAPIANPDYSPPGTSLTGKVLLDTAKGKLLWNSIIDDTAGASTTSKPTSTTSKPATAPKANGNAAQSTCTL